MSSAARDPLPRWATIIARHQRQEAAYLSQLERIVASTSEMVETLAEAYERAARHRRERAAPSKDQLPVDGPSAPASYSPAVRPDPA
jgi:hypothetical protein